jgi:hypothetical protein
MHLCDCCTYRLRQAEKKKKKLPIHVKNPAKKKDPKKIAMKTLEEKMTSEGVPMSPQAAVPPSLPALLYSPPGLGVRTLD